MAIHRLPSTSISSLTATQVLTHPPSLIKELLENSIDASATLISVELTPNCLDVLQVKDNGCGVLPGGDRECLCRRGWTSKISGWEEIERWEGGVGMLGFRGEALAAAAEMAGGGVEVTTRVEGEKVGWVGVYSRAGELDRQSSKSVPVGTTVKVMGFLKNLPVRREAAIKSATKHLQQIRRTLITYALSHPKIRFSMKVLPAGPKAKPSVDDNWVYSPSKTVQEAVMKIFGKELAGSSIWVEKGGSSGGSGSGDVGSVEVQAFLMKAGIDPSSLPSKAKIPPITGGMSFIFVDSRPISSSRPGPFKSLLSLYKNYIRSSILTANPNNPSPPTVSDPFIYINIRCKSPGMYDPNIEPAKDDVLFRDWDKDVLGVVEGMLREVYGELKGKEKGENEKVKRPQGVDGVGFGVLLARKPAPAVLGSVDEELVESERVGVEEGSSKRVEEGIDEFADPELDLYDGATPPLEGSHNHQAADTGSAGTALPSNPPPVTAPPRTPNPHPQRQRRPTWGFSMSANLIDDDDLSDAGEEYLPPPPSPPGEKEAARKDVSLSNPWVMAKMNAPVRDLSSPVGDAGASPLSVHRMSGGGSSSTGAGGGGVGWAERNLPPGYQMTSTNRNRDAIMAFNNNGSSSPFPPRQRRGVLDKWISSSAASASASGSGAVGKNAPQDHGDRLLPMASSPIRERVVEQLSVVGHVRRVSGAEEAFMTAAEFMAAAEQDQDDHSRPDKGIGRGGTGFTPVNTTSNYHQKFGGVEGPGGVIVRSSERRERAVNRAREEGNLWPNPLKRHPFPQEVNGQDVSEGSEGSEESEQDGENMDVSLRGEGAPVVKRRKVDVGKGKGKGKEVVRGSYGSGGEGEEGDEEIPERDEQLDLLFTQPPPLKQQLRRRSVPRMVGQKKFVPPLLKPRGGEVADGSDNIDDDMINNALQSPPRQLPARSPHRNRQKTATAALGMAVDTVVNNLTGGTTTAAPITSEGEPEEPQAKRTKPRTRTKPRNLLPLERVAPEERMHNKSVTVHFSSGVDAVGRLAWEVGRLNLGEYTAHPRRGGIYSREKMRGEWVGEVMGEWLRRKIGDGDEWERELVRGVKGWEDQEGEGEGEGQEQVRSLVAVWR